MATDISPQTKYSARHCHRARNPDDIIQLQGDIDKLVESANKW